MSPWQFMDGVMREVQEAAGEIDVRLIDDRSKDELNG